LFKIQGLGLSFKSAKDLRNRAEILPGGPSWKSQSISTVYPTKNKIVLYYRDPIECIRSFMGNPLLQDSLELEPYKLYNVAKDAMRVYTDWMSGEAAWSMQVSNNSFMLFKVKPTYNG
jgi:hypothetical protein